VGRIAPVGEGVRAQAFFGGGREVARRDDLVGVDVGKRQDNRFGFDGANGVHIDDSSYGVRSVGAAREPPLRMSRVQPKNSRGSGTRPRTAAAAAVAGLASKVLEPAP